MSDKVRRIYPLGLSRSFSARLSFHILLITAAMFLLANGIVAVSSHVIIREEAIRNATSQLRSTIHSIETIMTGIETSVKTLEWTVYENRNDEKALYRITQECLRSNPDICGCAIAFEPGRFPGKEMFAPYSCYRDDGSIESKDLCTDTYDYRSMDWFMIPKLLSHVYWTDPYYDEGGAELTMTTFSRPLYDENGELFAIMTADMNLQWLSDYILSIKPYENARTWMVASNGSFVVHQNPEYIMNYTIFTNPLLENNEEQIGIIRKIMAEGHGTERVEMSSGRSFLVYAPLKNGWPIAIVCPFRDVFRKTLQMNLILLLVTSFGLFIMFVLCLGTVRRLTRPLSDFSDSAMSIAGGDFNTPLPRIQSRDEMWRLRESFATMQSSLVQRIEELKRVTAARERIDSELTIARAIQLNMLPKNFKGLDGISLYAMMHPAKEVGGDLYDYFERDGKFYFCIGDVSGKGVPASIIMAITRNAFRYVAGLLSEPDRIMTEINESLAENNDTNQFVSLFIGVLDLDSGEMKYCNGGHTPLYIIRPDGSVSHLYEEENIVVGVFKGYQFRSQSIMASRGSTLFMYTDGVTEAENVGLELYGDERLRSALLNSGSNEPECLVNNILGDMAGFTCGAEQNDDVTILAIKYNRINKL